MARESFVVEFIKETRKKDPKIGGRKLWLMYKKRFANTESVGFNSFYDIMEHYGLKIRKRRRRIRTTNSDHNLPVYPNLIKKLIPDRPNQLYVSDITYIPILLEPIGNLYSFCYLSLVTDYYSKQIVGYDIGESLQASSPINALNMALGKLTKEQSQGLIHHSDRGVQYASFNYTEILRRKGIKISMTESGDPRDNAVAERVNNTIKNELLADMTFFNVGEVRKAVSKAIDFYNNDRPHMSLDYMTPSEAASKKGEIKKKWTSFRELAIKNKFNQEKDLYLR